MKTHAKKRRRHTKADAPAVRADAEERDPLNGLEVEVLPNGTVRVKQTHRK